MSTRGGGGNNNDDVVRGAGVQLAKGAGLVLVAIIIGIVLLQVVDDGSSTDVPAATNGTTTTTAKKGTTVPPTTVTTVPSTPQKQPEQVRLIVLNAGAPTGAAGDLSDSLRTKGYTTQVRATDWPNANRQGTTVLCKPAFSREGAALAVAIGGSTKSEAFPNPPPPSSANVDCVVAVGA
jgi:hypothetical protein